MTEMRYLINSAGEIAPNVMPGRELRIAETASEGLPNENVEIAKQHVRRVHSARRIMIMVAEGRLLDEITDTTRRQVAERLATKMGIGDTERLRKEMRQITRKPASSRSSRTGN